jgi:hypothetical protein
VLICFWDIVDFIAHLSSFIPHYLATSSIDFLVQVLLQKLYNLMSFYLVKMHEVIAVLVVLCCLSIVGLIGPILLILMVKSTAESKGKWGLNVKEVICPRCKAQASSFRIPKSIRQFLWGGWTCSKCGCEFDKWGKEMKTS